MQPGPRGSGRTVLRTIQSHRPATWLPQGEVSKPLGPATGVNRPSHFLWFYGLQILNEEGPPVVPAHLVALSPSSPDCQGCAGGRKPAREEAELTTAVPTPASPGVQPHRPDPRPSTGAVAAGSQGDTVAAPKSSGSESNHRSTSCAAFGRPWRPPHFTAARWVASVTCASCESPRIP